MKLALDISPISADHYLQHRVRGTGFYLKNLKDALLSSYPEEEFIFFKRGQKLSGKIDVVHYPYFEPFFLTLPLKKIAKTIVTVHDLTPLVFKDDFPVGIKGNLKWKIQKNALEKSDLIITDSNSSKKDIVKLLNFDEKKIKVVYLAAADYFKPVPIARKEEVIRKFSLPEKFILYVGDVTPNKNLSRLIEAVNKTSYYFVIVGQAFSNKEYDKENAWNKDLKKAQELASKNDKITSLGFVKSEDLVSLYNASVLLVMPSLYEGFGLPVLEAMQSGCPVITTRQGSLPEVAGEAAFYVDPLSPDSITSGIKKVFEDDNLRKKLSEKGIQRSNKFTWKKTAEETYKTYKIISGNK